MAREQLKPTAEDTAIAVWNGFEDRAALASALAGKVADKLAAAIVSRGHALLAVSGGSTPALFFRTLSSAPINWSNVTVTLVDERLVPETSPRSNAALVRSHLLQNEAAAATFVPLYSGIDDPAAAAAAAAEMVGALGAPLDIVILGMGLDGHTASFFPDADNLDGLLDPRDPAAVRSVGAASAGEPRLTLALPTLAGARFVGLHIEGEEKRAVIDDALAGGSNPPVRRVLAHAAAPEIFWAP